MAYTKVRPIPAAARERLDKLLLMLGAANEGERAAAAGAVTRLLAEHGLDWHDLVGAIGQPAAVRKVPAPPPSWQPKGPQSMTAAELRAAIASIKHRVVLNERARQFLAGMSDRADIFDQITFSHQQWVWLRDLLLKAGVTE